MPLLTFEEALGKVNAGRVPHVLLGNGFSRACRDDIFAYGALFDRADFNDLSPSVREAFTAFGTRDFEVVMRALRDAGRLMRIYAPDNPDVARRLIEDAAGLREVLVRAIAQNHPEHPDTITAAQYAACRRFLAHFKSVYTLNYDLLLYWALMRKELEPALVCDDGFRAPEGDEEQDYVTWEPGRHTQNIHYLHGALHIFDARTEVQKYTWTRTGIRLIEQIRQALGNGLYPIFVAEGESAHKLERIRHSDILSKALRSFQEIHHALFVYGHSMAPNDDHILRLIGRGKLNQLFVGIYGDPDTEENRLIARTADSLRLARPRNRPLQVEFFDATTGRVWG